METSFVTRLRPTLRSMLAALTFFALAIVVHAQGTPKETFEAFKKAFAARDGAAATALMKASDADKEGLTKQLPTLPEEALKEITGAELADLKINGDAAIGVVMVVRNGAKNYDDQLFIKVDGKWLITDDLPTEDAKKALREWYDGRLKELQAADKK